MDGKTGSPGPNKGQEDFSGDSSARARNRTVMLTPEMTSQVRSRLAREMDPAPGGGFVRPGEMAANPAGAGHTPAGGTPAPYVPPSVAAAHPAPTMVASAADGAVWTKESPIVGFLVSFDSNPNGEVFTLRSGRLIVTSEPAASGNYMFVNDESVSPMHAIMRISATGEIQVLDQLSEHGTKVRRFGSSDEQELSGDKSTLEHGDVILFGKRSFHVCVIATG